MEVDDKGRIYWDGERLVTDVRLNWWQATLAVITAASTLVMAFESLLRIMGRIN